jgi:hypothetical protein
LDCALRVGTPRNKKTAGRETKIENHEGRKPNQPGVTSESAGPFPSSAQQEICMISRLKAGLFMIGGSVTVFGVDAFLTDESALQITMLGPVQNFLFFVSILLLIAGIYFIVSSKPCPACRERVRRTDTDCRYCGWIFKIPRRQ